MIAECPKCRLMVAKRIYRTGLQSYYLKGSNREMSQETNPDGGHQAPLVNERDEHFEMYCPDCGYGWVENIIEKLPGSKGPSC